MAKTDPPVVTSGLLDSLAREELVLWRPDLRNIPAWDCPDGISIRRYEAGDEKHWVRIHEQADPGNHPSLELYHRQFGTDTAALGARQFFLAGPKAEMMGTTTAWFYDDAKEGSWGRVHWVAILPEYHGKGYSRLLQTHALAVLRELGHTRAFLTTDPERLPAVNLYLRFGFKPWLGVSPARDRWNQLIPLLKPEFRSEARQWLEQA